MIITFATTFFKPFWFEAALSVNLTTMLMMTTISIGKMQMLPTAAYIRMIDVWLVFCQLVPFAEVILLTAQDCCRGEDPTEEETGAVDAGMEKNKTKLGTLLLQVAENNISIEDKDATVAKGATFESSSNGKLDLLKTLGALKSYDKTFQ